MINEWAGIDSSAMVLVVVLLVKVIAMALVVVVLVKVGTLRL